VKCLVKVKVIVNVDHKSDVRFKQMGFSVWKKGKLHALMDGGSHREVKRELISTKYVHNSKTSHNEKYHTLVSCT
jgi:hypothetical protein